MYPAWSVAPKTLPKRTARALTSKRVNAGESSTRDQYTGMSGQFFAMSEFLWRGYNVAIPAVDTGEDIFVVDPGDGTLRRVQVKTAGTGKCNGGTKTVQFKLSRSQLNLALGGSELFFMLVARWDDVIDSKKPWRFILIRRQQLNALRTQPVAGKRGRALKADSEADDQLMMTVELSATDAKAWGHSLRDCLDQWSADWPVAGPMKARGSSAAIPFTALLAPSPTAGARFHAPTSDLGTTRS
jgi:hypothetical protein